MKIIQLKLFRYLPPLMVAACVPGVFNPTVSVMPGPGKPLEVFATEQAACKQFAEQQITAARDQINSQLAGSVLLNAALGASQAAGGSGGTVAASAASSGLQAASANAPAAQAAAGALQQQYDVSYSQCMYARGNQVPGYAVASPVPDVRPRRVRRAPRKAVEPAAPAEAAFVEPAPIAEPTR